MEFIYLLFIIPIFFLLRKMCYVKNFLLDDKSLPHKSKFSKKKTPLLGGVLILISFLFIDIYGKRNSFRCFYYDL